jgi:hypothetical protein
VKTTSSKLTFCKQVLPKLLEEELDEALPSREEVYRQGYEGGYRDAMEEAKKLSRDALQVTDVISSKLSNIELSEGALANICEHLTELFEAAFKGLFLLCPVNLNEVIKALLETCKSKQIGARVKIEVSAEGYERLKRGGCLSWPNAELCVNSEFELDQCRLSYLDIVVEYDKKFLQSELASALGCAKFTYNV